MAINAQNSAHATVRVGHCQQGTKVEGVINRLFEGRIQKSITCLNVPYTSKKTDAYMDVFLDVRGCKNIYESFDRLTAKERMDGANQYSTDKFGLQVVLIRTPLS